MCKELRARRKWDGMCHRLHEGVLQEEREELLLYMIQGNLARLGFFVMVLAAFRSVVIVIDNIDFGEAVSTEVRLERTEE